MVIQVRGLSGEESYNLECFSDCVATCHPNPTSYSLTCFRPEGAAEQAAQTTLICYFYDADEANVLANGCLCIRPNEERHQHSFRVVFAATLRMRAQYSFSSLLFFGPRRLLKTFFSLAAKCSDVFAGWVLMCLSAVRCLGKVVLLWTNGGFFSWREHLSVCYAASLNC